jgi:CRISPR system Cascade subunit CasD
VTATLLLRMQGPMQSFGVEQHFAIRGTEPEPTFSCVLGIVLAALGRREGPIDEFVALEMGVRVDRPGGLLDDFHTVLGGKDGVKTALTNRYYVADASYLVGLQGDAHSLLVAIHSALARPDRPLFLGRKCCVPSAPLWLADGLRDEAMEPALRNYPLSPDAQGRLPRPEEVRLVLAANGGDEESTRTRMDVPLILRDGHFQSYGPRTVYSTWMTS